MTNESLGGRLAYSVAESAEQTGISEAMLRNLWQAGQLRITRVGGCAPPAGDTRVASSRREVFEVVSSFWCPGNA